MSVTLVESPSPTSKADITSEYLVAGYQDSQFLYVGSIFKGGTNNASWLMFEPNIPAGSTLVSAKLDLFMNVLSGAVSLDVRVGWLGNDGIWNLQTSSNGWGAYGAASNFSPTGTASGVHPDRTGVSDSGWINNFPSFNPHSGTPPASGTAFSFGGGAGISPTFSDSAFLTDAQDAFDGNETNRTARGVPMAVLLVPTTANLQLWNMASNENATVANRPTLTIVYDPPAIAAEITSTATVDANLELTTSDPSAEIISSATVSAALSFIVNNFAAEIISSTVVDPTAKVWHYAVLEITSSATVDAGLRNIPFVEIESSATVVATAAFKSSQASEIASSATAEAELAVNFGYESEIISLSNVIATVGVKSDASAELTSSATVFASMVFILNANSEIDSTTSVVAGLIFTDPVASEIASSSTVSADLTAIISPVWPIFAKVLNGPAITSAVSVESTVSGAVTVSDAVTSRVFVRGRFHPTNYSTPEERGVRVFDNTTKVYLASEISVSAVVSASLSFDQALPLVNFNYPHAAVDFANNLINPGLGAPHLIPQGEHGPVRVSNQFGFATYTLEIVAGVDYWINVISTTEFQYLPQSGGTVITLTPSSNNGAGLEVVDVSNAV